MIYRSLFNFIFHHAYFLDKGEQVFADMSDSEKAELLRGYVLSDYLRLVPTPATQQRLKGYRFLFKPHAHGFRVVAQVFEEIGSDPVKYKPLITLPDDFTLSFALYITDPYFENYSEIAPKDANTLYLFSNIKPDTEAAGFADVFSTDGKIDPPFLLSEEGSRKIMHTISVEDRFLRTGIDRFSIANIDEADINTPEAAEIIDQYIQTQRNKGLIGFVRLAIKGDNDHNLLEFDESDPTDVIQYMLDPSPEFTLSFSNRKTFWRYTIFSDGSQLVTEGPKPLVKNGFVQIESTDFNPEPPEEQYYPNPTVAFIKKEDSNYYSDIFI